MTEVEQTELQRVFGDTAFVKIVDTLLSHPTYEYTKTELAEVNDVSKSTVYSHWDRLEELDIVEESRAIGNTKMWVLNTDSRVVEALYGFEQIMNGSKTLRDTDSKTTDESGNQ
jgi:DNA-binding transcriptional ArsR family regulator